MPSTKTENNVETYQMNLYDKVIPFQLEKLPIRGRILVLEQTIDTIIHKHDYPDLVGHVLSEAILFGCLMSSSLKHDGIFTLQTRTDGPINLLVADVTEKGIARGYAEFDKDKIDTLINTKQPVSMPRLLGNGQLALTLDQSDLKDRYQGFVELVGSTFAESLQHYFTQSEQLKTALFFATQKKEKKWRAAGILLQLMPQLDIETEEQKNDHWITALSLLSTLKKQELLSDDLTPYDILFRLFHEHDIKVFDPKLIQAGCRCSRERIFNILHNMTAQDREDLVENLYISVNCQFCNEHYEFTLDQFLKH